MRAGAYSSALGFGGPVGAGAWGGAGFGSGFFWFTWRTPPVSTKFRTPEDMEGMIRSLLYAFQERVKHGKVLASGLHPWVY